MQLLFNFFILTCTNKGVGMLGEILLKYNHFYL